MTQASFDLIRHMLPHVGRLGWGEEALWKGAKDMGLDPDKTWLMVGASAPRMINLLCDMIVQDIQTRTSVQALKALPIQDRMITLIMDHLEQGADHKPALLKTIRFLINPLNAPLMLSCMGRIVEALWRQAGDQSTDFTYYTKRLMLGKIYLATLLYWLRDRSINHEKTKAFLEKQLKGVLAIPKIKQALKKSAAALIKSLAGYNRFK